MSTIISTHPKTEPFNPSHRQPVRPSVFAYPRKGHSLTRELPGEKGTVSEERQHRKERLAAAFRVFAWQGFDLGGAGHITARDPEWKDHFWVNPHGVYFGHVRASDLILVNHHGDVVEGDGLLNRAAFAIHSELHQARPDVLAAAHTHAPHGKSWSALGRLLDPISQDACAFYNSHVLFDDFTGVVLDSSEGQRIAKTLGNHKAVILQNHGFLTVGQTIEGAAWRYIAMENAARVQLAAEAAGKPIAIPHDVAEHTAGQVGTEFVSWVSFLPLLDRVIREEPDFRD